MAEIKTLNTRIKLRIDTLENWNSSTVTLLPGEVAFATVAATAGTGLTEPVVMAKIATEEGKTFKDLPWAFHAKSSDVLAACKSEAGLKAFVNSVIADAGIATSDAMEALAKRVTTAEGEIDALQTLVGDTEVATQISDAIAELDLANTYEAKGAAGEALTEAKSYADGLNTAMDTRVKAVENQAHTHANATELAKVAEGDVAKWNASEQNAKEYADGLDAAMDARVDALEAKFGNGEGNVESQIAAAVAAEKADREAADTALSNRVKAVEDDYLKAADKTALQDQITANNGAIAALQGLVGDANVAEEIGKAVAAEAEIARAAEKANAEAIEAVSKDYLKAADKTELTEAIATAKQEAIATVLGEGTDEDFDTLKEVADWILSDTTGAAALQTDVATIKADYLKAADKTELQGKITDLEGLVGTTKVADQISGAIADANLAQYALDSDLDAAVERIGAAEGEIDALQELVGDTKVSEAIATAIADENLSQYALAADLDTAEGKIETLEGKAHEHANKTVLDGVTSEKVAAWDAAVQTVTAGTGLTASKTGTGVSIAFDDECVFVFDCGGADVVAE